MIVTWATPQNWMKFSNNNNNNNNNLLLLLITQPFYFYLVWNFQCWAVIWIFNQLLVPVFFEYFRIREPSVLWEKIQKYTYYSMYMYTDIYSQALNTHVLDLLLPIGCEKSPVLCTVIWIFKEPSISVLLKHFRIRELHATGSCLGEKLQNQRTAVPSYSKSLEEPAVLVKKLVKDQVVFLTGYAIFSNFREPWLYTNSRSWTFQTCSRDS